MRPRVSLAMIVKNEAHHLERCLGSVAGLVDEMVIVDTGSTDDSRALAARLGARVVDFPWRDSFAEARNESLRQARGAWVVWLDADEWLDDTGRARFQRLRDRLDQGINNAVVFMRQHSPLGGDGASALAVAQPRLFRNDPGVCWRYRVHEQVLESCLRLGARPILSAIEIQHSGYASAALTRRKAERNRRLLEHERAENPEDPWVLLQLGRLDLADHFEAAEVALRNALQRVRPEDPLGRQIFATLIRGYWARGQRARAEQLAREGLARFPNDANLLFASGSLAFERGDLTRAESAFHALITNPPDPDEYLGTVDPSLRGAPIRHNLAVVYHRQGRLDEAEAQWRTALLETPDAPQLWRGLAEIALARADWTAFTRAVAMLEARAAGSVEVSPEDIPLLKARAHLARGESENARTLLAGVIARNPYSPGPRLLWSRAERLDGDDRAAEATLRALLDAHPEYPEARRALAGLLRERRSGGQGVHIASSA